MKKFTVGKFEILKLNSIDIFILSFFLAIDLGRFYLNYYSYVEMYKFFYDLGFAGLLLVFFAGSFLIRFRNLIFSLIWLFLSVIYIIEGDRALEFIPLLFLLLYHSARYAFVRRYNREFIPPELGKGWSINSIDVLDGKVGGKEDTLYLRIIAWVGLLIVLTCLVISGKR